MKTNNVITEQRKKYNAVWRLFYRFARRSRPWVYVNTLPPDLRYIGLTEDYYDKPIYCIGFWWFHVYWFRGFYK